jgi:Fe-S-cluster formation regulator IscX/YfhJ
MSESKRIKLDLNLIDIESIISFNYDKKKYESILNLYDDIKYEDLSDYIYIITCLSSLKLEKYDQSIDIFSYHYFCDISDNIVNIFIDFFNLESFLKDKKDLDYDIIIYYVKGYAYKKLNNIEKSKKYFDLCKYKATEKILIFFVKHIENLIIELYELDKNKYFDELLNLYKFNDLHKKVVELYEFKDMKNEINNYIKNIIQDEYIFMLNDDNIEYYLNKYIIIEESDILFLLEKYVNLGNINKIKNLLNISIEQNVSTINNIKILNELIKLNHKRIKYCEQIFEIFENNNYNDNTELKNIFNDSINYYNNELRYSHRLGNINYKKYLNKENLDRLNNNFAVYLNLYKYFDEYNIKKDNCIICLKENIEIITLNCHHTHKCCYKCYYQIDKCPMCRDKIYK